MFKKFLSLVFAIALAFGVLSVPVQAAVPVSYESSIQLRNLTDSEGTITLTFYDLSGEEVASVPDEIAANETKSYYQSSMPIDAGFNGSVVIASSVEVAAESNIVGLNSSNNPISYAAYGGFSEGSNEVYLPTLFKNNYGYNTFYYVQNSGSVATDVEITYSDGITNEISDLQPGQSKIIKQSEEAHTLKVFSGTLASTDSPIVVTVVEEGNTLFSYNGFGSGSTNPIMPLVNQNNYGYFTGIQIQNTGDSDTIVTVSYTPSISGTACSETRTVPAGASKTFSQYVFYERKDESDDPNFETDCVMDETFIGSGKVSTNTASMPLVAVVNQLQIADNKGGAYAAFDPSSGKQKIIYPLIMDRNYGYFTSWSIVNVGSAAIPAESLICRVTGTSNEGPIDKEFKNDSEIPVNGSWTLNHLDVIADGFVGGATCLGPSGSQLIGTSNQLGIGSRWAGIDTLLVSEGFVVIP
jgi:hypothetical protein